MFMFLARNFVSFILCFYRCCIFVSESPLLKEQFRLSFYSVLFYYWKLVIICMLTKYIVNLLCIFHRKTFCYDWHTTSPESSSQFLVGFVLLNIYIPQTLCGPLCVLCFLRFWSLYCLFVALRLLTTPFATSNFSFQQW